MKIDSDQIRSIFYFFIILAWIGVMGEVIIRILSKTTDHRAVHISFAVLFHVTLTIGGYGAQKENQYLLITYAPLVFVLSITFLTIGIHNLVQTTDKTYENKFIEAIAKQFKNYTTDRKMEETLNKLQTELKCCGAYGPSDFMSTDFFIEPLKKYPHSCCDSLKNQECITPYTDGCGKKSFDYYYKLVKRPLYIMSGVCIEWFGTIFLALFLVYLFRKEEREQSE